MHFALLLWLSFGDMVSFFPKASLNGDPPILEVRGMSQHTQLFVDMRSHELFARLVLNHDHPDLSLPSS
jgi:hypothetical protein